MSKRHVGYLPLSALTFGILMMGAAGCHSNPSPNSDQSQNAAATQAADESQDPAEQANLAPAVATTPQPSSSSNQQYAYNAPESDEQATYASDPPPPLPDYDQPEAPGPDYIWNPGYWNYANAGYYWVPGAWALAPYTGALWTPGYWGFYNNRYIWHPGYWGPHVGFYGGVNYGHGYTGVGYVGGYWDNGSFRYNTAITRVNPRVVRNVYSHHVRVVTNPRVSYNGGRGGLSSRPLTAERVASRERHMGPLPSQEEHRQQASQNRDQWASQNHGHPRTAAATRPLNAGRHAPDAMPPAVREQVQRERQGQAQATESRSAHPETQRAQARRNESRQEGQTAPPATERNSHRRTRPEERTQQQPTPQHQQRREQPNNTDQIPHS